jgi:hypothetical protein
MQQQKQKNGLTMTDTANLTYLVVRSHATCFWPFLRERFGSRALGLNVAVGAGLIIAYAMFTKSAEMFVFLAVWLTVVVFQKFASAAAVRRGWMIHSRDSGYPKAAAMFGCTKSYGAAVVFECVMCLVTGAAVWTEYPGLGRFITFGAASMLIVMAMEGEVRRRIGQSMMDARINMNAMSDCVDGRF